MQRFSVSHPALNGGLELATATVRGNRFCLRHNPKAIRGGFSIANRNWEVEGAAHFLAVESAAVSATTNSGFVVGKVAA